MNKNYQHQYNNKSISFQKLYAQIIQIYQNYDLHKLYNYDEILFILDQQCHSHKCDRDVAYELFSQIKNVEGYVSLHQLFQKYIENIQSIKVCLIREQNKILLLENQSKNIYIRQKTYIYLKMIQISVFSHFSRSSEIFYVIRPSKIPPISLSNSLNPILNHEFTFQMQADKFDIAFFDSGIEIYCWTFPDRQKLKEGQYQKSINTQNISFEVIIKYLPKNQNNEKTALQKQIHECKQNIQLQRLSFHKICTFEPFLQKKYQHIIKQTRHSGVNYDLTESLFEMIPILRNHLNVLHFLLITLILFECFASTYWSIELINILFAFYMLGVIYDYQNSNYGIKFLITAVAMFLSIFISIWGSVKHPIQQINNNYTIIIVICIVLKILIILSMMITMSRKEQIQTQKIKYFYDLKDLQQNGDNQVFDQEKDIWESQIAT